jgi:hypothetical protein
MYSTEHRPISRRLFWRVSFLLCQPPKLRIFLTLGTRSFSELFERVPVHSAIIPVCPVNNLDADHNRHSQIHEFAHSPNSRRVWLGMGTGDPSHIPSNTGCVIPVSDWRKRPPCTPNLGTWLRSKAALPSPYLRCTYPRYSGRAT